MRRGLARSLPAAAVLISSLVPTSAGAAQGGAPPSLLDQLTAQYKLARVGGYGATRALIEPGTLLTIQKGGILGIDPLNLGYCPAKYQNGTLKPPNSFCANMAKNFRNFEVGEKVYATKMDVNLKDEKISMKVVACDTCNAVNPPMYYKSEVDFVFPKGFLEQGDVTKVEDTIGEIFALDNSAVESPQSPPAQAAEPQPEQPAPAPPTAAPAAQATIQLNETIDQVVSALGQPEKKVDLGVKQIYVYKDLKVTFLNGKVADVQ